MLTDLDFPGAGVLNGAPLVIHCCWWNDSPYVAIEALSGRLRDTPCVVLVSNAWSLLSRYKDCSEFVDVVAAYKAHKVRYPQHAVIFLANDPLEKFMLDWQGVECVVFQHNGFYHPDSMPLSAGPVVKDVDALYVARIEPYKRVELMAELRSACVVFAGVDQAYFRQISHLLRHVRFANGDPLAPEAVPLPLSAVTAWCARARCGLCLSELEGAMFASIEYLLCGLPIVSTRSVGGRDEYFDERYWIICDDTPAAVATAVHDVIARRLDAGEIRAWTLATIMAKRAAFLQYLIGRVPALGGSLALLSSKLLDVSYDLDIKGRRPLSHLMNDIHAAGVAAT